MKPTKSKPNKTDCNRLCSGGNPWRIQQCNCSKCHGAMHGATNITFSMLETIVDHKLLDPKISLADFQRWHSIMQILLAHKPSKLRKAA